MSGAPHSLRKRLLLALFLTIGAGAMLQAAIAYLTALDEADEIFDAQMAELAHSISGATLSRSDAPHALPSDERLEFAVSVWSRGEAPEFESYPELGSGQARPRAAGFGEAGAGESKLRTYVLHAGPRTIQVAQRLASRREFARTLAMRFILPILVLAPLLMLAAWSMVTLSLRSLERLRHEISRRASDDLTPLPDFGLPREMNPVALELNSLLARVGAAMEARRRFVDDAAHELRTPLTALRLQAAAVHRAAESRSREVAAQRLLAGVDRAVRLVEQMLSLAREEARSPAPSCDADADLSAVARAAIDGQQAHANVKRIDLGLRTAASARVRLPAESLESLLRNLIDNAVKYTPVDGRIDVAIAVDDSAPSLTIDDSGPGIASTDFERAFDRFYRGPGSPEVPGSGLGLSIVAAVARRHGVNVRLERSASLGGLRVVVSFAPADRQAP